MCMAQWYAFLDSVNIFICIQQESKCLYEQQFLGMIDRLTVSTFQPDSSISDALKCVYLQVLI